MALWEGKRKVVDSTWTGGDSAVLNPSPPPKIRAAVDRKIMNEATIAEYRAVAEEIGVDAADMLVEEFRIFLAKHDIPTFNLGEVTSYMDGMAAKDNPTGYGWHWCPVRPKDAAVPMTWGRASSLVFRNGGGRDRVAASDFYQSHRLDSLRHHNIGGVIFSNSANGVVSAPALMDWREHPSPAYTRTLPLHALKKIAFVERSFKEGVVFLVTDYEVAPHSVTGPDPFLMAVIPNSAVSHGKGRFVIDVWDEPGFGIDRMVK